MLEVEFEVTLDHHQSCYFCNLNISQITTECGHPICATCFKKKTRYSCCPPCWKFSRLKFRQDEVVMHPEGEGFCEIHMEDQKLFCGDCWILLCVSCSKSEHHRTHIHWPIAVAAMLCREKMKTMLHTLHGGVKQIQTILSEEKEKSMARAVMWADHRTVSMKMFHNGIQAIQKYLQNKKEEVETTQEDILINLEKMSKKFRELYLRLEVKGARQDNKLMEEKKSWEAMMSRQNKSLTDKIKELEERMQKTSVEVLQEVTRLSFNDYLRFYNHQIFRPFVPRIDISYYRLATKFLRFYQSIPFQSPEKKEECMLFQMMWLK